MKYASIDSLYRRIESSSLEEKGTILMPPSHCLMWALTFRNSAD